MRLRLPSAVSGRRRQIHVPRRYIELRHLEHLRHHVGIALRREVGEFILHPLDLLYLLGRHLVGRGVQNHLLRLHLGGGHMLGHMRVELRLRVGALRNVEEQRLASLLTLLERRDEAP